MGGRYHTTHVDLMGCSFGAGLFILFREEDELFDLTLPAPLGSWSPWASLLSFDGFRSKPPGVLGVFADDPKDANAPEPRPKADDAPTEGEETLGEMGAIALKGLERPREPSKRLEAWLRGESDLVLVLSLGSDPGVDRESLLDKSSWSVPESSLPTAQR